MIKFLGAPGTLPPRNLIKKLTGGPMMPMPPSPLMGNQYPNPNGGGNCMHHHACCDNDTAMATTYYALQHHTTNAPTPA